MKADVSKTCDIFDRSKECYHRRHFFFSPNWPRLNGWNNRKPLSALKPQKKKKWKLYHKTAPKLTQNRVKLCEIVLKRPLLQNRSNNNQGENNSRYEAVSYCYSQHVVVGDCPKPSAAVWSQTDEWVVCICASGNSHYSLVSSISFCFNHSFDWFWTLA